MDKPLDELREDIHKTLAQIDEQLRELSDYLTRLRDQTIVDLNTRRMLNQTEFRSVLATSQGLADPRRSYLAGRQPRVDGDSYGSVPRPTAGGAHGTQSTQLREQRRTEEQKN